MPEVKRPMGNPDGNPLIVVSRDEVMAWLRQLADDAGFADRATCAFQLSVETPFAEGKSFHHDAPELLIMVSNIPNSRTA